MSMLEGLNTRIEFGGAWEKVVSLFYFDELTGSISAKR